MADENPLVTVVITNYNYDQFLARAVRSVLDQNYTNLEILLADDASTDQSAAIAQQFSLSDPRVRVITNNNRLGLAKNKNRACVEGKGSLLTFLDADDYYCSLDKISREVRLIVDHEKRTGKTCVAYSLRRTIVGGTVKALQTQRDELPSGDIFMDVITRQVAEMPRDFTVRKKVFDDVGGFDESAILYVDWVLKIRLARRLDFYCTNSEGIAHVKHPNGMAGVKWEAHRTAIVRGYVTHRKLIPRGRIRWNADLMMWKRFGKKRFADFLYKEFKKIASNTNS